MQWNHKQPVSGKHTTLAAGRDPFFKMATIELPPLSVGSVAQTLKGTWAAWGNWILQTDINKRQGE